MNNNPEPKTARKLSDITHDDKNSTNIDPIKNITDAITDEFDIKMNVFDKSKCIIVPKNKKYKDGTITFDDVSLHLCSIGITTSDTILRKILKSPHYTKMYNPILDYFNDLKFDSVSQIDILCNHLKVRDFGDKKKGYYQKRFNKLFKKWLVATVACAFGKKQNDVNFGLIHTDEGIGKSYFFEFLAEPFRDYYITITDKKEQKLNLTEAFVKNLLINFDELCGIDKRNPETFKSLLSAKELLIKERSDPFPVKRKRLASGCFTSNKNGEMGGFLTQSMGYRRFGSVEIDKIDHAYSKSVDPNQVWAEAVTLFNSNYDHEFGADDFTEFKEYNSRYIIETPSMKLIQLYYEKPINGEECEWIQPKEMVQELLSSGRIRGDYYNKISPESIGGALTALHFEKTSKRINGDPKKVYHVRKL